MRYIIDTTGEKAQEWGNTLRRAEEKGEIIIIEKGDPIEQIKETVRKIGRAFETLQKAGIDEEVMIAYIRTKGVPKTQIDNVIFHQKEFLEKLGVYSR